MVITDRLHGMIFAHLFGIPVIVLPSLTGKVADSYLSWYSGIK